MRRAQAASKSLPRPVQSPLPQIDDCAKNFFISEYVFCKTGRFPYMDHFWLHRPPHAHLAAGLQAVSLSCLAVHFGSNDILRRARQQYDLTIRQTNAALQLPHSAKHNATLLTVLLLYLCEKLTRQGVHDASGEWKHLKGALSLLELSDATQFIDPIRLGIFRQCSMCILSRCITERHEIPRALLEISGSICSNDPDGRLEALMIRFVDIRNRIRKRELTSVDLHDQIVELDESLVRHCSGSLNWTFADAIVGRINDKELFMHLIESTAVET